MAAKKTEPTTDRQLSLTGFRSWIEAQENSPEATIHTSQLTRYAMMALDAYERDEKPVVTENPTVTLAATQWQELIGMTTQGVQMILSELAKQQGGLSHVVQLSTAADQLLNEIKKQLPQ